METSYDALQDESQQSRSSGEDDHVHHVRSKSNKSTKSQSIDGESQKTTELQPLETFERHPTDPSSNCLEDDEKVEMPRSSKPVAPGVIFQGKADLGLMSSECLMLRELLQSQHEDMMIRFDHQQEMLNKIYRTRGSNMSAASRDRRPSIVSSTASGQPSQSRRRSARHSPQKMPDGGGSTGLLLRVDSPQATSFQSRTKLFSSLTRVDEELRQKAAVVDAEQAKAHRQFTAESEDGSLHFFEAFVANPWFDLFFAIAILTNAIFIGFEVQASIPKFDENLPGEPGVSTMDDELAVMLSIFGKAYAGLFFVELCIRVLAQRRSFVSMRNPEWRWNLMDTIIVLASLVEMIFEVSSYASGGEEMSLTGMSGLRTLRIIRITRLVKIARLARILRFVMALRTLTQSILHTLKSLIWAVVLLLLIVYTFAILSTQVVNDYMQDTNTTMTLEEWELGRRYFSSLPKAMLCLYMSIANGVSWEQVIIPLNAVSVVWDFMFLFYIAFATLAVLNVITGVFCQSAIDSAQSDEMSKTRTTSAEEYLKEFFETEVKTLWPKGWMTSRILFRESKSVHTRVTSALFKPKKVPGPKKQGESLSPSDAMDTSSLNADSILRDNGKAAPDTSSSVNTSMTNPAVTSVRQPATVIPMMAAVKNEKITENTSTAASATTGSSIIKTIPKLNPSALSVLKAKLIINNPGVANKGNFVMQPGNKVVSATILKTKPSTAMTTALSSSAQASMVASAAKALAAMVTTTEKSSVPMVTTTKLPASVVSSVSQALGITKGPLSVGSVSTKPSVSMVTTSPSVVSMVSKSNPLTLKRMGIESRGAVTKGENTMEGRSEAKAGVTMATNVTTNGMEKQQQPQQAKFPVSMSSSLNKSLVSEQRLSQPVSTAVALSTFNTSANPANSSTIKSQPVTILDFADMVSADSQNDAQEILSNQLQPQAQAQPQPQPQPQSQPQSQPQPQLQPQQPFINKSPSPQKPKEPTIPMMPKASVVSPPRQQNTAYSVTSPSSMIRSPTKMTQTRNSMPPSSAALANMLMSCNMASANMANMQNKYIDLNAAAMMAQRQQSANNKTLLDSISAPARMPMDMHTVSVPLTHPVISHQLSNPTQSATAYLPTNIQPTLSMLGHANLQGKATNPLSHISVVPQSMQSSMMHMNRPLQQQQQQQQQQQSNMVMAPTQNPFNQVLIGYNVPSTQSMPMSQPPLMNNPNIFQDPNHNPNGGHPSSSFMPRFS